VPFIVFLHSQCIHEPKMSLEESSQKLPLSFLNVMMGQKKVHYHKLPFHFSLGVWFFHRMFSTVTKWTMYQLEPKSRVIEMSHVIYIPSASSLPIWSLISSFRPVRSPHGLRALRFWTEVSIKGLSIVYTQWLSRSNNNDEGNLMAAS
jgi:hypothetical protein